MEAPTQEWHTVAQVADTFDDLGHVGCVSGCRAAFWAAAHSRALELWGKVRGRCRASEYNIAPRRVSEQIRRCGKRAGRTRIERDRLVVLLPGEGERGLGEALCLELRHGEREGRERRERRREVEVEAVVADLAQLEDDRVVAQSGHELEILDGGDGRAPVV